VEVAQFEGGRHGVSMVAAARGGSSEAGRMMVRGAALPVQRARAAPCRPHPIAHRTIAGVGSMPACRFCSTPPTKRTSSGIDCTS
jgi:hypothetical protein